MYLRTIISHFARETATRKLREAVDAEMRRRTGDGPDAPDDAAAAGQTDDAGQPQQTPPCDVLVVFALGIEAMGLVDRLGETTTLRCPTFVEHSGALGPQRLVVIETGVGREAAAQGTDDAIEVHRPAWVVSAGFAAGLRDGLRAGRIVMADHVLDGHALEGRGPDGHGEELAVGFRIDPKVVEATPGLHVGRLVTVDKVVRTPEEKRLLGEQHDALAADMETSAVAEVCRRRKVRFLSVRVISDGVDDELPREIERMVRQHSLAGKLGAATRAILGRPSAVKDLWKLKDQAFQAAERLASFLTGVLPQLPSERDE